MNAVAVFGGTLEGRELAERLAGCGAAVELFVATGYGAAAVPAAANLTVRTGRLDREALLALFRERPYRVVVDATHPYAAAITANLRAVCPAAGLRYLRVRRAVTAGDGVRHVATVEQAAAYLDTVAGNVLLTTGSKDLAVFTRVTGWRERLFARVLPDPKGMAACAALGFAGRNLIGMQGPFTREMNAAMIRMLDIRTVVTKDTGVAGGFPDKAQAARECGAELVVIRRPTAEDGVSPQEAVAALRELLGLREPAPQKPVLTVIGGGMGDPALFTAEADAAIRAAGRIYAPPRLAQGLAARNPRLAALPIGEILQALQAEVSAASVVVSGDTGFFSLARTLGRELGGRYELRLVSGVSSLQYLCARRNTAWDDAKVVSLHGRRGGVLGPVSYHPKVFFLTGGEWTPAGILHTLCDAGLGEVTVTVGEELSTPGERLTTGTASALLGRGFSTLSALLVENPAAVDPRTRLRDTDFVRGEVPMTKEAVRCLSVQRLEVRPGDVVWDIGAGTGSVSIALAYAATDGMVCAVERKPEALALLRQNRAALGAYNIAVVEAEAPACLEALPAPDKVFIGGSGGRLREILALLTQIAPHHTVCVNAIALETAGAALAALEELGYTDIEAACVNVAGARAVGGYHLMTAQNPVTILSGNWRGDP